MMDKLLRTLWVAIACLFLAAVFCFAAALLVHVGLPYIGAIVGVIGLGLSLALFVLLSLLVSLRQLTHKPFAPTVLSPFPNATVDLCQTCYCPFYISPGDCCLGCGELKPIEQLDGNEFKNFFLNSRDRLRKDSNLGSDDD